MIGQKGIPAIYGGVEKHVHDLAIHLAQNHDIYVYSRKWYSNSQKSQFEGVNIIYTPTIHTKHLDTIVHTLTSTIHAIFQKYDIIHYHGVGPSLLSWIPRVFAPKTKIVTTFHSIDRYHQKWNFFAKVILRLGEKTACTFAQKTIAVSESIKQYCLNEFNKNVNCIPNGVNEKTNEIFTNKLTQFNLQKNNYFIMVSRLVPHKGAHILVEAFQKLKSENKDNENIQKIKLAIVGGSAYTDNYIKKLHLQASSINDILFTDFQTGDALEQLYANAIALVHPSLNEGLPITVLQAMSYGVPTLVSKIPEHLEIIKNPEVLFQENNVEDLKNILYNFLQKTEEEKQQIGKENLEIIQKYYSWQVVVPQIEKVYKMLLKK